MERVKRWCFTSFDADVTNRINDGSFVIIGRESCPETKKTHYQGYIEFKNGKSFSAVKKLLGNDIHLEKARGSPLENITYCSKDGDVVIQRGEHIEFKKGKRNDIDEVKQMIINGCTEKEIADKHFKTWLKYYKGLARYKELNTKKRNWKTEVIYIYGESGVGKTRTAFEKYGGGAMISYANGFFIGDISADQVIFDEFDKWLIEPHIVLQLFDRYPMVVNVKGGFKEFTALRLICTGNEPVCNWRCYDIGLRRRIDVVEHITPRLTGNTKPSTIDEELK